MFFQVGDACLVTLLDPSDGERYVEPVRGDFDAQDLDQLYNITKKREDTVDPTEDGTLK